jgi:CRP-like cAMP-binding protein
MDLKRFPLLAELLDDEYEELAACLEPRFLAADETLFEEREEAETLVLVAAGTLRLSSSHTQETSLLAAGAALGGLALFAVGTREVTAVAAEATGVLLLSRADYRRLADDSPRVAWRLAEGILAEVASDCRAALSELKA